MQGHFELVRLCFVALEKVFGLLLLTRCSHWQVRVFPLNSEMHQKGQTTHMATPSLSTGTYRDNESFGQGASVLLNQLFTCIPFPLLYFVLTPYKIIIWKAQGVPQ